MVSRRLVRVKIMQLMYAQNRGVDFDPKSMQTQLEGSLKKTIQLQWVFLNYLVRISEYDLIHHAKQRGSETAENTGLLANHQLLLMLQQHPMYKRRMEDYKVESFMDNTLVRKLYLELISRERFNDFAKGGDSSDPKILSYMLKKLIAASDPLEDQLSNLFINYLDDQFSIIQGLAKSFKAVDVNNIASYDNFFAEHEEEKAFGRDLVLSLQKNLTDVREIMLAQVRNWDEDRLAPLDTVLIMMAIAEFLYCPHVPVKVTINEYIDISKDYSSPKSKDFINGVIDKAMWALKDAGRIEKLGRGLKNS
ncbi:MAG: hypothetical protein CMN34_01155 [Saprospirales bacterium]|nr:hypothetical protein [Saprospirales bacterium]